MFAKWFIDEARTLYPGWKELQDAIQTGNPIIGRYLDDAAPSGMDVDTILRAKSLESLQQCAAIIKRKQYLYHSYVSGKCYDNSEVRRQKAGCPRLYAQANNDEAVLNAFYCAGVSYIPDCPKYKTEECWRRFDELGFDMK